MELTPEQFARARDYLMRCGRPLEQALFRRFFEAGATDDVLSALEGHQTDCGGFLDMGEGGPDGPSPIGSTVAFQHLVDIGAAADCSMVQRGIDYFLSTYDHEHNVWPQAEETPEYFERALPRHWGNPSAEIVGYLWRYRVLAPEDFLVHVTDVAMGNLRALALPVPGFSDLCFLRAAKFMLPRHGEEIIEKIAAGVHSNLQLDHRKWDTSYFIKPYWYAMTPEQPLYGPLKDEVEACLDFEIASQEPAGSFRLTFTLTDQGERTWRSIWTLEALRALKAHGRIEGVDPTW